MMIPFYPNPQKYIQQQTNKAEQDLQREIEYEKKSILSSPRLMSTMTEMAVAEGMNSSVKSNGIKILEPGTVRNQQYIGPNGLFFIPSKYRTLARTQVRLQDGAYRASNPRVLFSKAIQWANAQPFYDKYLASRTNLGDTTSELAQKFQNKFLPKDKPARIISGCIWEIADIDAYLAKHPKKFTEKMSANTFFGPDELGVTSETSELIREMIADCYNNIWMYAKPKDADKWTKDNLPSLTLDNKHGRLYWCVTDNKPNSFLKLFSWKQVAQHVGAPLKFRRSIENLIKAYILRPVGFKARRMAGKGHTAKEHTAEMIHQREIENAYKQQVLEATVPDRNGPVKTLHNLLSSHNFSEANENHRRMWRMVNRDIPLTVQNIMRQTAAARVVAGDQPKLVSVYTKKKDPLEDAQKADAKITAAVNMPNTIVRRAKRKVAHSIGIPTVFVEGSEPKKYKLRRSRNPIRELSPDTSEKKYMLRRSRNPIRELSPDDNIDGDEPRHYLRKRKRRVRTLSRRRRK
jgi:hypothetical protein